MTVAKCTAKCQSLGYTLVGLEFSSEYLFGSELESLTLGWNGETRRRERIEAHPNDLLSFLSLLAAQCMCSSALATTSSAVAASECSMTCAGESSPPSSALA